MFGKKHKESLHIEISRLAIEQAFIEGFNTGFNKGFELGSSGFQAERVKSHAIEETLKRLNNGGL